MAIIELSEWEEICRENHQRNYCQYFYLTSAELADGTELEAEKLSDGRWAIELSGIMADHLADTLDVVVKTSGGTTAKIHVSALTFAQVVLGNDTYKDDMDVQRLATALWRYWRAADAYMQAHATM